MAAVVILIAAAGQIAHGQSPPMRLRAVLTHSCAMTDEDLARLASREVVIHSLKSRDKKEIVLCGIVRLDRTTQPTVLELHESLSQKSNRSILTGGPFSDPPTKYDLHSLKLEKNDLDALLQCKPGKCSLLVSDTMLQTLEARSDWQYSDLGDLYLDDLIAFVRNFRTSGIDALASFDGLSKTIPLRTQNRTLISVYDRAIDYRIHIVTLAYIQAIGAGQS